MCTLTCMPVTVGYLEREMSLSVPVLLLWANLHDAVHMSLH